MNKTPSSAPTAQPLKVFARLFTDDFTAANGSPNAEAGAKERFRNGIVHAREAHKIALELLP